MHGSTQAALSLPVKPYPYHNPNMSSTTKSPLPTKHEVEEPILVPLLYNENRMKMKEENRIDSSHHQEQEDDEEEEEKELIKCRNASYLKVTSSILSLSLPMAITGLLLYSRSLISMLFLGRLGELPLAAGALAICFANITAHSVLSGLAAGLEPLCGQAFGAGRSALLGPAFHRAVILLLFASIPVAVIWANAGRLLLACGQDAAVSAGAHSFLLYLLPELPVLSLLHPLRVYLRSQCLTTPLTCSAAFAVALHVPATYVLVQVLDLGLRGVALANVLTDFALVLVLLSYVYFSGVHGATGGLSPTSECLRGWGRLLELAIPSCVTVCLEWWWYEIMMLMCGLLPNPRANVATMGILIQTTSLVYVFPSSLSCGVSTLVGNALGAGRAWRAKRVAEAGVWMGFCMGLAAVGFARAASGAWAGAFTSEKEVRGMVAAALPLVAMCELGNCPQTAGCGVLRGSARPRTGARVNAAAFYCVGLPVAAASAFAWGTGMEGLWTGMAAAQACCVVAVVLAVRRTDWELEAQRAHSLVDPSSGSNLNNCGGDGEFKWGGGEIV